MGAAGSAATLRLQFRFAPEGRIRWSAVVLAECEPAPERKPVRVAAAWWTESDAGVGGDALRYWADWLDKAGEAGADVALIPESFNLCGGPKTMGCVEPFDGPSARLLSSKSKQWRMITAGTVYAFGATPATAEIAFNTAYVYGRDGALLGVHNKNILYETRRRTSQPGCGRSAWFWASRWSSCGIFWWHV